MSAAPESERRLPENLWLLEREREELERKVARLEAQVTRLQTTLLWGAKVFGPVLLGALFLAFLYLLYPARYLALYGYVLFYPWPPLAKAPLFTMVGAGYSPLEVTVILGITDALIALWFVLNFELLYRIPRLGARLERADHAAERAMRNHKWLTFSSFLSVFLWVVIPFPGTGTLTGAIVGRLLGLGLWKTYAAVVVGAVLSTYGYASGADVFLTTVLRGGTYATATLAVTLGVAGIAFVVYRQWWRPRHAPRPQEESK